MVVAWIVLNQKALEDFGPANLAFYMSKGLVKTIENAKGPVASSSNRIYYSIQSVFLTPALITLNPL